MELYCQFKALWRVANQAYPILNTCLGRESAFTTRASRETTIVPLVSLVQVVKLLHFRGIT